MTPPLPVSLLAALLLGAAPLAAQQRATQSAPPATAADSALRKVDPAKAEAIRKLLDLTGAGKMALQMVDMMIEQQKQTNSSVPPEFWTRFREKLDVKQFVDLIIPIYDRHFTLGEIQNIIAFYESPTGRKLSGELPAIMTESSEAGQRWGFELGMK